MKPFIAFKLSFAMLGCWSLAAQTPQKDAGGSCIRCLVHLGSADNVESDRAKQKATLETDPQQTYFIDGKRILTALGLSPNEIKMLPPRAGVKEYAVESLTSPDLFNFPNEAGKLYRLVWPEGIVPPESEEPEILSEMTGHSSIVWKNRDLHEVFTASDRVEALTYFPFKGKIAFLKRPLSGRLQYLEIISAPSNKSERGRSLSVQISKEESWTHMCWMDETHLLFTFQGRVSCGYAIYNIISNTYEILNNDLSNGSFELRGKELWCRYASVPRGEIDREEKILPWR